MLRISWLLWVGWRRGSVRSWLTIGWLWVVGCLGRVGIARVSSVAWELAVARLLVVLRLSWVLVAGTMGGVVVRCLGRVVWCLCWVLVGCVGRVVGSLGRVGRWCPVRRLLAVVVVLWLRIMLWWLMVRVLWVGRCWGLGVGWLLRGGLGVGRGSLSRVDRGLGVSWGLLRVSWLGRGWGTVGVVLGWGISWESWWSVSRGCWWTIRSGSTVRTGRSSIR